MELAPVLARLEAGHDRILEELKEFTAIPSVSTNPAHGADMRAAATWVAAKLTAAGPFTVRTMPTPGASVVYAEWLGAAGAPTALIYGHYDVQPEDPLEQWLTPPFTPTLRDGRLYARGVSDDKGPMLIPIKVAEAFFAVHGRLKGRRKSAAATSSLSWQRTRISSPPTSFSRPTARCGASMSHRLPSRTAGWRGSS
jgi:acetylornithine deacetylase/succinyl-diaminopimelate desuccinylase-like protein